MKGHGNGNEEEVGDADSVDSVEQESIKASFCQRGTDRHSSLGCLVASRYSLSLQHSDKLDRLTSVLR